VMPAPMGRAFRIRKRSNHITIVLAQRAQAKKPVSKTKTAAESKTTAAKKKVTATKEATEK